MVNERAENVTRRERRYLLREGHVIGGLCAVTLYRWSVWLFALWAGVMLTAWLWDLWRQP